MDSNGQHIERPSLQQREDIPSLLKSDRLALERVLLAAALFNGLLVVFTVGATSILSRMSKTSVLDSPLFVAAITTIFVLLLIPFALRGRGPLVTIARRLPASFDAGFQRRPVLASLVAVLTTVAIIQIARLSCFMADPSLRWGSAYPPVEFGVRHMCMSAYVHAADLTRRGVPNVYAEEHYPAYGSGQPGDTNPVSSSVANLAPHVRDAFEYPPPFLMLPRAALVLTNDFLVMRTGWFMLQATLFCAFALFLASWVGGSRGTLAGLLLPGILSSFPLLFNLQFGQFHLVVVLLAMGGMLAFQGGRDRLGGALLAGAIVTKIFPALLLIYLALRRRNRPILWTLAFAAAYTLAGLIVLGSAPYRAFFEYQLPRLASGEAFHVLQSSDLILAANASVYSIPFKLQRLGVLGMPETLATVLTWLYTALLVGVVVIVGRRQRDSTLEPMVWLGILTLASLRSPVAPNVYVSTSALWLLTLLAVETRGCAVAVALLVVAWVCISVQPPLPDPKATIALWMSGQIVMLILGFWVVSRRKGEMKTNTPMRK